jgi:FMN reductase
MSEFTIVGITGNLTRPSKTRALVGDILRQASSLVAARTELYDVIDAGPELGATVQRAGAPAGPDRIFSAIERADALVVASPIFKASYTGLFKHLFDLLDPKALEGRPILVAATAGSDRHALVLEHQFRPLFAFFRANVLPIGIYAINGDFEADGTPGKALIERIAPAAGQLAAALAASARAREASGTIARVA